MKLEHILAAAVFFFAVLAIFVASHLGPWDQGMFVGVLFGVAFAALCSTPMLIAGAERDDPPAPAPAPVAPRPPIEWHDYGQAYMPARARGERPAARIAAQTPTSLAAMLHAIPGAQVRPPLKNDGGDAVIVATLDEAFVERVRAAVRLVRGVDVLFIGGEAPADRRFDPYVRGRYLWAETWRDGEMLQPPEPRKRADIDTLRWWQPRYWIVRPAGEAGDFLDAQPRRQLYGE